MLFHQKWPVQWDMKTRFDKGSVRNVTFLPYLFTFLSVIKHLFILFYLFIYLFIYQLS